MSQSESEKLAERISRLSPEKRTLFQRQLSAKRLRGFDLVARSLRENGISHMYGIAGRPTEEVLPACVTQGIRPIGVYHQTSAVCMALAHNYQSGRLVAAALVSAGPATTNAITGLLVARENGWPVIVLGGRRSSFQKFDPMPIVSHVTKHAVQVPSTDSIGASIHEACQIALSDRPGPVYLDLHEDVLTGHAVAQEVPSAGSATFAQTAPSALDSEIDRIAATLLAARRPAMLLGKGVRWSVAPAQLRELCEVLALPFITSPMGRGFIPDDHPLCFNRGRTTLQSQADVILVLGARLNWVFRHGTELSRNAQIFRVDTCRDDEHEAVVQTEFVHADAGDFVTRLLTMLKSRQDETTDAHRQQRVGEWHKSLHADSEKNQQLLDQRMNCDKLPMSPYRMMKEIRDALPRDAICTTEGNVSMLAAQTVIPAFRPAARMDAGTNACMGVSIPFAIGAKVACPDKPVVAVAGDYGFSLSAMEMEVCVRHGIPIVVVVANNQGNNGATKQRQYFPGDDSELVTMFQPGLQYDRVMKMFGGQGTTISDPNLLKPTLAKALAAGKPCCVNVVIDPHTPLPNAWGDQCSGADAG